MKNDNFLKIYNTLKKQFSEINDFSIMKMYVCGPTLYNEIHIGNGRSIVVFDAFFRFFKHIFKEVIYVRNITDIDDKIINKCMDMKISPKELVDKYEKVFKQDLYNLNVLPPTYETKATEFLPQMYSYIQTLLDNNCGYVTENNNIYFDVEKIPEYNFFQDTEELQEEARVKNKEDKKHWKDFALWKSVEDEYGYKSPWGYGRPGWHLECSVMSSYYLGDNFTFHGGGEDLAFPHHHNEIAQGIGFCGKYCSDIFVHNGMVNINDLKMSKTVGNIIKVKDIGRNKHEGDILRYIYLSTHYRSPINFKESVIENSTNVINKIREFKFRHIHFKNINIKNVYIKDLYDDFNCIEVFNYLFTKMNVPNEENYNIVINTLELMGFDLSPRTTINESEIKKLFEERNFFKNQKDYINGDKIRKYLEDNFVKIEDSKKESIWFYI